MLHRRPQRARIERHFDPIPFWYAPDGDDGYEFSAITQRPMHIYHSWGTHNGWIRQITAENCLYINRARAGALGIADDDPRVNPNGGAIALGHPLGMSGARLVLTAMRELEATNRRYALCTMCIGVGQGMAIVIERV